VKPHDQEVFECMVNGHSFIRDIYIAPLQETYTEPLSVQLRPREMS